MIESAEGLEHQIGVDRPGAVADQHGKVVDLASFSGFDHDAAPRALALPDQMMMHGGRGQKRRNGNKAFTKVSVRENEDGGPSIDRLRGRAAQVIDRVSQPGFAAGPLEEGRQRLGLEARGLAAPQPCQVGIAEQRRLQPQEPGMLGRFVEEVEPAPRSDSVLMTTCSRMGSIGGFVTWAKSCLK